MKPSFFLDSFNSFAELDFKTCGTTHMLAMSIIPNSQLVLDDSLNFAGLKIKSGKKSFVVAFLNLRGINIEADVFKEIAILSFSKKLTVSLTDSSFEFYYKNNRIDDMICNEKLLYINNNFLSKLYILDASSNVIYPASLCPLAFHKAKTSYF